MSEYEALKMAGHSPAKAAEILLDARRGDQFAVQWVKTIVDQQRRKDHG